MKKLLIVMIALLTCLAITLTIAAGIILTNRHKAQASVPVETQPSVSETEIVTEPTITVPTEAPTPPPTVSQVETVPAETAPETQAPTEAPEDVFEGVAFRPVNRTVYARQRVNVRKGPAVSYDAIGKLEAGSAVEQIGIGDNRWSKIWFQGQKAYVASQYLVTEKPQSQKTDPTDPTDPLPDSQTVSDTVYATGSVHVRSGPGKAYHSIGYLKNGQSAERVAIMENGWSKIRYNNGYGYVSNAYLKTEKPSDKEPVYQDVDETVYATENLNLRSGPGVNHKISAKLKAGESVRRISIGDNGWSEVLFEGSRLYASSQYLTKVVPGTSSENTTPTKPSEPQKPEKPMPECKKVDETLVAAQELVIYSGPGTSYKDMGRLRKGSLVHRTGIFENGWSRILLEGREVYVVSAYLAKERQPEPSTAPSETTPSSKDELGYTKNEKTVYAAADDVNVRSAPSVSSEKLGKVDKGEPIRRLAIGDDGWSKVLYKEHNAYIKSSLLTEDAPSAPEAQNPEKYQKVNETVYAADSVFVRTGPGTDYESLGSLNYGDSIQRIGIGDQGWSQVIFHEKTAYASSRFLTTEKPEIPDFGETTTPGFPTPNSPFIYQYVDSEEVIPHAVFLPVSGSSKPLPVIISLHGSAEVDKNREFMEGQHLTKVFREWEYTKLNPIPALVVCPHIAQGLSFDTWGTPQGADAIFELIEYLDREYDIDKDRIILEGHSMGGQGAMYIAADDRACFQKLVVVSGYDAGIQYDKIKIPVKGCVGGGPGSKGPQDSPFIYQFMSTTFKEKFGSENLYEGPYNHDNVAIEYFQKDADENGYSDIIEWMLNS